MRKSRPRYANKPVYPADALLFALMRKKGGAPLRKMASVMLDGKEKIMTIDSIKRYTVSGDIAYPIHEDPEGDFVTYEDHVAAIKADRKRRGEPVAWIRKNGFRFISEIEPQDDSEVPLYATPQPAEPCASSVSDKTACGSASGDCDSQPAEPVDISAFDELIDLYQDAQRDGTFKERTKARTALREAYRKALAHPAEPLMVNAVFETENGEVIGTTDAKVKRVEWQDDGSLTVVIDYWPQPAEPVKVPPATAYCQHPHCQTTGGCQGPCSKKQAEPVKVPSSFPTGTEYSVEPHGNGYAIYQGRDQFHHGLNLAHLTECTPEFAKRIESALNTMYEPEGWQVVPKEPTPEMLHALMEWDLESGLTTRAGYQAMLKAAPKFGEEE